MGKYLVALMSFLGSIIPGCDPNMKRVNDLNAAYETLVAKGQLNSESEAIEFNLLASVAEQVKQTQADKKAGKAAEELLQKMTSKYLQVLSERKASLLETMKEADQIGFRVQKITNKIIADYNQRHKRKYDEPFPFKEGDCLAMTDGKEFSTDHTFLRVRLFKVERVGKEAVLLRSLFKVQDQGGGIYKQIADESQPEENYKNLVEDELKVSCSKAEELRKEFSQLEAVGTKLQDLIRPLVIMAKSLGRNFLEDANIAK